MVAGPLLLTGASGLLGTWLRRTCPTGHDVVGVVHRRVVADVPVVKADLRDADAVKAAVRQVQPSLVLHTAYAKDRASIIDASRHVVEAAAEVDADIVLVSTDAVFSGDGTPRG